MTLKTEIMKLLESSLFIKNGTCPICGKVLFITPNFLCEECWSYLPVTTMTRCKSCGRPKIDHKNDECKGCRKDHLRFSGGFSWLEYKESGKPLVAAIKFRERPHLGIWAGKNMGEHLKEFQWFKTIDLIIPIPLHTKRLKERGYNQSEKIAQGLLESLVSIGGEKGIKLDTQSLIRTRNTPHQVGQEREERLTNLKDAFRVVDPHSIKGKNILLVDDVLTTGATLGEGRDVLLGAQAAKVFIATICAVPG
ncbi:MAG: ComF family protein [Eubacteriaceae bacterium]